MIDAGWKGLVVELVEDVVSPTEFISCFFELDVEAVDVVVFVHLELQDLIRCPSEKVGFAEYGLELLDEGVPLIDYGVVGSA